MQNNSSSFEWDRCKSKQSYCARRLQYAIYAIALLLTNLVLWSSPSHAEQLLFQDDFDDGVILDEWTIPDTGLELIDGRVRSTQNGRTMKTLEKFSGDLRIEFDFEKEDERNHSCWDLAVGFGEANPGENDRAIIRFDHNGIDALGIGKGPNAICDGAPLVSLPGNSINVGHGILSIRGSNADFAFSNEDGETLEIRHEIVAIDRERPLIFVIAAHADAPRYLDNVAVYQLSPLGDFNEDGLLTVADIDLLATEMEYAQPDPDFDLNVDFVVDELDLEFWVHSLKNTFFGDANLDGEFNSSDLVAIFTVGKYETQQAAGWAEGNWNGDDVFGSSDLVFAFQDGGYEQGPRNAVHSVPEPASGWLSTFGLILIGSLIRRTRRE